LGSAAPAHVIGYVPATVPSPGVVQVGGVSSASPATSPVTVASRAGSGSPAVI
jgi:hypothetical protein